MKAFQTKYGIIPVLFILLAGSSILSNIPNSYGQEANPNLIPDWIKNSAGWWATDQISEREFLSGIEYLINNKIILIDPVPCNAADTNQPSNKFAVPYWVKNNAGWWSEDLIEDIEFINALEYLITKQIISIDNRKIIGNVPLEDIIFSPNWGIDKNYLVFVQSSFFEIYGTYGDCVMQEGKSVWGTLALGLNPNKMNLYNQVAIWNDPQKMVVVYPYFTAVAYTEPGFYTYYRGECDSCTTTKFTEQTPLYSASALGHQSLSLLGYHSITDIELDRNPDVLTQFDKVIMLHNEYVTRTMFDAITNHPNVIYLYPNALYAEIEVNYIDQTITLIRGHNYPEHEITNGFDWEFDNTHPYEYDNKCNNMEFYKIKNGWMTTCYPEVVFLGNDARLIQVLKALKDLGQKPLQ